MAVAKSYENWEIVGDVFTDEAGKEWVRVRHSCPRCGGTGNYSFNMMYGSTCFRCSGSGKESKNVRWYTDEERARMDAHNEAEAAKRQAARMSAAEYKRGPEYNNFGDENGYIDIVLGNTYPIKDTLKAHGCKYTAAFGWYIPYGVDFKPEGYDLLRLNWAEVSDEKGFIKSEGELRKIIEKATFVPSPSEYQGQPEDKITRTVTVVRNIPLTSYYGDSNCHIMEDVVGNIYVWTTAAKNIPEGSKIQFTGKVKAHQERKGVKQTIMTRLTIKEVE